MGAANKVLGYKISGKKVLKKINPRGKEKPRKKDFFIVNHAFSLVRGLFSKDFFAPTGATKKS